MHTCIALKREKYLEIEHFGFFFKIVRFFQAGRVFVRYRKDKGKGNVNVHGKVIYRFVGIDKRYVSRSIASFPQFV